MKAFQLILIAAFSLLTTGEINSQIAKNDSIFWDNGNVSILSELDRVWILQKKGGTIKDARLLEIKKEKGVLVYEKEKCLHDISIGNIAKITPGKNAISMMYFQADNTPNIKKIYESIDLFLEPTDFKCAVKHHKEQEKPSPKVITPPETNTIIIKNNSNVSCDTLIDEEGQVIPIKITLLQAKMLNYKKMMNPDGPTYVKPFENAIIIKYANSTTINLNKKP